MLGVPRCAVREDGPAGDEAIEGCVGLGTSALRCVRGGLGPVVVSHLLHSSKTRRTGATWAVYSIHATGHTRLAARREPPP